MAQTADERMARIVEQLEQAPGLVGQLTSDEGAMARAALDGQSVYQIAQSHAVTEEAVWALLGNAARAASGRPLGATPEMGGMGSDTDPGVTGGYGETAMGSLESEPSEASIADEGEDY